MADDEIVFEYQARRNQAGAFLPGVPLRDLTRADWRSIPKHLQRAVEASNLYERPEQAAEATEAPAANEAAVEGSAKRGAK